MPQLSPSSSRGSLKYAGTVTTASLIFDPRYASAVSFIFNSTIEETSSGWNFFSSPWAFTTIMGLSPCPAITLNGQSLMSDCTMGSANLRPMSLLASKTVFSGFLATWFLAASPMRRSVSVNATYEGVVRLPWSLAMISTPSFFQTPTHEYVVPRSMPTAVFFDIAPGYGGQRKPKLQLQQKMLLSL